MKKNANAGSAKIQNAVLSIFFARILMGKISTSSDCQNVPVAKLSFERSRDAESDGLVPQHTDEFRW